MDFQLFFAILKRYKRQVIGGTVLGIILAVLSYGTPGMVNGKPGIVPRGAEVWQGEAELLFSQSSDPYGRTVQQSTSGSKDNPPQPVVNPTYLTSLPAIYAAIANGSQVQSLIEKRAGVPGTVAAAEVDDQNIGIPLPLLTLTSSSPNGSDAAKLAYTAATVLQQTISEQQNEAGTPADERVALELVKNGSPATLTEGHKKTVPILVLFAFLAGTVALAFIRNNHSPQSIRSARLRPVDLAYASPADGHADRPVEVPHPGWASPSQPRAPAKDSTTVELSRALIGRDGRRFQRGAPFHREPRD